MEQQPIEHIDLSNIVPPIIRDREFNQNMIGPAMEYLKNIRDHSVDYVSPADKINIQAIGNDSWNIWLETPDGIKIFSPTTWAKNQTIGVTKLPAKYHDALIEGGHIDEAVNHLNMWLHEGNPHRIRSVGDQYRAMVSPGYAAFDNFDAFVGIAGTVKAANLMRTTEQKPVTYYKAQVSDQNMYVHILDEGRPYDLSKTDVPDMHFPMITFKNSEVGAGAMAVEAGFFRGLCSNMMIMGVVSRRIHRGEKLEEGIYSQDTLQTQNELWKKILRDSVNAGIANDTLFDKMAADIKETKEIKVDQKVAVEKIAKSEKMTQTEQDTIIAALMGDTTVIQEDRGTLYQVMQGMTMAAKDMGIERGMEIQKIAGNVNNLIKVVA